MASSQPPEGPRQNFGYYCYRCRVSINDALPNLTCPMCHSGFIEEHRATSSFTLPPGPGTVFTASGSRGGMGARRGLTSHPRLRGTILPPDLMNALGMGAHGGARALHLGNTGQGGFQVVIDNQPRQGPDGAQAPDQPNPVETMLNTFLTDLISSLGGAHPGQPVPMVGNLGDYVFGHEGLDSIVTQLMNQMEGSGPAPMAPEQIDQLKKVTITKEDEAVKKLDCCICCASYQEGEVVTKLDCDHYYHTQCINEWLVQHATCPICRRDFSETTEDDVPCLLPPTSSESTSTSTATATMPSASSAPIDAPTTAPVASGSRQVRAQMVSRPYHIPGVPSRLRSDAGGSILNQMGLSFSNVPYGEAPRSLGTRTRSQTVPNPHTPMDDNSQGPPGPNSGLDQMDTEFD